MVRLKTRWLLVRIDYTDTIYDDDDVSEVNFPSKNELARAIRDNLIQCSGVACSGAALDTNGTSTIACSIDMLHTYKYHRMVMAYDVQSSQSCFLCCLHCKNIR